MTVVRRKLIVESKSIEIRRKGIKIRTYENAEVFTIGVAGRSADHWAAKDFEKCRKSDDVVIYFSGKGKRPGIVAHGGHIHVIPRDSSGSLIDLDPETAENEVVRFVETLQASGIKIRLK